MQLEAGAEEELLFKRKRLPPPFFSEAKQEEAKTLVTKKIFFPKSAPKSSEKELLVQERQTPYAISTNLWSYSKPREVAEVRETEEEERQRPYPVSTHLWSYSKPREVAEADEKEEERRRPHRIAYEPWYSTGMAPQPRLMAEDFQLEVEEEEARLLAWLLKRKIYNWRLMQLKKRAQMARRAAGKLL